MDRLEIDKAIKRLRNTFGIHGALSAETFYLEAACSPTAGNRVILDHLGIKNRVRVELVSSRHLAGDWGGDSVTRPAVIALPQRVRAGFGSTPIVTVLNEQHLWSHWWARWIKATILVDERYRDDFRTMGAILAHEDTHLKLRLAQLEADEPTTDIAALVLGLGEVIVNGRYKLVSDGFIERLGYLDDNAFNYALQRVGEISARPMKREGPKIGIECPQCGRLIDGMLKLCPYCGVSLTAFVSITSPRGSRRRVSEQSRGPARQQTHAEGIPAAPRLIVKGIGRRGREFPIDRDEVIIGHGTSGAGAATYVDLSQYDAGRLVSRRHARIIARESTYCIEDIGSTNGTFINKGSRLLPGSRHQLRDGDEILLGRTVLWFKAA